MILSLALILSASVEPFDSVSRAELDCGCFFHVERVANCSNRASIDFKCLRKRAPTELWLRWNNYSAVPEELLHDFNSTRKIDLSNNYIEMLPAGIAESLPQLRHLVLDHNNFSDPNELLRINIRGKASMHYNPFKCDCSDPNYKQILYQANNLMTTVVCANNTTGKPKSYLDLCYQEQGNSRIWWPLITIVVVIFVVNVIICRRLA
ncbi:leucine-rich repeat-containing protein 3B [Drosophila virilis]|uniref:LRRCT domain-containing protein n=1 Tax=Drosophila virilis TaxID=7244 RepID=A0A0Q9WRX9_DROVI|nr:slit homolog 3 protein [Drosophila virilis]KRF83339.1 uncharacterized protein Dvir_GJ25658 [Drosophila virilis]